MVVVLMGVAGSGKTAVGRALAGRLGWAFVDADDRHSPAALDKMARHIPLDDADRDPWLADLHRTIAVAADRREPLVMACSALKERHRAALRGGLRQVRFVSLKADQATLRRRLGERAGHVAGEWILDSQLREFEAPDAAIAVDGTQSIDRIVGSIRKELGI